MKFILCLPLLLASSALAQIQLFTFDGTNETAVGAVYNTGTTAVGDTTETRFHIRNTGAAAVTVQKIAIAGTGFTFSSVPSLPYVLAPANFIEFRVQFSPLAVGSDSANLAVNSINVIVTGTAATAPALTLSQNGSANPLAAGATINFGRVQSGLSATLAFTIANTAAAPATVSTISVTGAAFSGPVGLTTPVTLAPGASATFQIVFQPPAASVQQGSLAVGQRTFQLAGTGFDPPPPTASLVFDSGPNASGQQRSLSVHFDSAAQLAGNGTLNLVFKPAVSAVTDDAAVQFMSTGRNASLTFQKGDTAATINGQPNLTFQTGTTAGDLVFTLTLGAQVVQTKLTITPAVVSIEKALADSRLGYVDITITGFDNTYSTSILSFTFYDRSSRSIGPSAITVDSTADFSRYFSTTKVGGTFVLLATFPVAGDSRQIGAADIVLSNSAGRSQTQHVTLP
ncbi:MAG TPA: choice-of-anchor D domain-containing protein [Bryobacteraceae bacterium]|nr:choice-of-anchor D domain-containing protein [Bryobacteraceae bacterium]